MIPFGNASTFDLSAACCCSRSVICPLPVQQARTQKVATFSATVTQQQQVEARKM